MDAHRRYYAQTMPGIEKIAWLEIRKRFAHSRFVEELFTQEKNGIVVFEYAGRPDDLLELRTVEDVFIHITSLDKLSRDWQDLRLIASSIEESEVLGRAIETASWVKASKGRLTYRVVARKEGKHQYRRLDLEQAVIKGVERRHRNWQLVQDDAEVEIWANVLGSRLLCGVRLSNRSMRHRAYRHVNLPAALRPSVAAALVFLTEPCKADVFLDPMCGSGTILAERILAGEYQQVLGGDVLRDRVKTSAQNLIDCGQDFSLLQHDARRLPVAAGSIDKVAVNLPFGKQIGSPEYVSKLYPQFFGELERILKTGGRAIVLSSEYELIRDVVRARRDLQMVRGYSVAVLGQWGRIYILTRS
jgi:23S rRNA G2445 N2-methylase RlmL